MWSADAPAASCSDPNACPQDMVCLSGPFGQYCAELHCNFNLDCPASRPLCAGGACQGTGNGGGTVRGPGSPCGRIHFGQVIKNVGCPVGLQCKRGTCQRPAA